MYLDLLYLNLLNLTFMILKVFILLLVIWGIDRLLWPSINFQTEIGVKQNKALALYLGLIILGLLLSTHMR